MQPKTAERRRRKATRELLKSIDRARRALEQADSARWQLVQLGTRRDYDQQRENKHAD